MNRTKKSVLTADCIALCVVLPMAFHSIPNAGSIFCPMHIPVLLCGLICGWKFGLLCGIAGPILSSMLTQMPAFAILPAMAIELAVYGSTAGALMQHIHTGKLKADLYISLVTAMLLGRIAAGAAKALLFASGEYSIAAWVTGHFITAWPALIIHIVLIPLVYLTLLRAGLISVKEHRH
ncbi:MAG: ECF transporter S component [Anaerotignum sp.]|nr:ECF transporter S component [Anaerotignum sp.]MBP3628206.1 ECF transporter S component [Anaerotignum sp.]MBQ8733975.1 ECF transporter S component [Anaerotignum sp.]